MRAALNQLWDDMPEVVFARCVVGQSLTGTPLDYEHTPLVRNPSTGDDDFARQAAGVMAYLRLSGVLVDLGLGGGLIRGLAQELESNTKSGSHADVLLTDDDYSGNSVRVVLEGKGFGFSEPAEELISDMFRETTDDFTRTCLSMSGSELESVDLLEGAPFELDPVREETLRRVLAPYGQLGLARATGVDPQSCALARLWFETCGLQRLTLHSIPFTSKQWPWGGVYVLIRDDPDCGAEDKTWLRALLFREIVLQCYWRFLERVEIENAAAEIYLDALGMVFHGTANSLRAMGVEDLCALLSSRFPPMETKLKFVSGGIERPELAADFLRAANRVLYGQRCAFGLMALGELATEGGEGILEKYQSLKGALLTTVLAEAESLVNFDVRKEELPRVVVLAEAADARIRPGDLSEDVLCGIFMEVLNNAAWHGEPEEGKVRVNVRALQQDAGLELIFRNRLGSASRDRALSAAQPHETQTSRRSFLTRLRGIAGRWAPLSVGWRIEGEERHEEFVLNLSLATNGAKEERHGT